MAHISRIKLRQAIDNEKVKIAEATDNFEGLKAIGRLEAWQAVLAASMGDDFLLDRYAASVR